MVPRETGPGPRETAVMPPTQSGGARCHDRTCRASLTDGTRFAPPEADAFTTSSAVAVRRIPPSTTYSTGVRCRALGGGIRLLLTCDGIRPTCLREGRDHRVSSSSLESRLLRSVTSAESHGSLPSKASALVSRETDSQTRRGRHGSADVIPRSALPG